MPSVSKKQHNLMAAVANNPAFAKKAGIPQSVGSEFVKADKGKKFAKGGDMKKIPPFMGKETKAEERKEMGVKAKSPAMYRMGEKAEGVHGKSGMKKPTKYAAGGFTKAADGIAQHGKTKAQKFDMGGAVDPNATPAPPAGRLYQSVPVGYKPPAAPVMDRRAQRRAERDARNAARSAERTRLLNAKPKAPAPVVSSGTALVKPTWKTARPNLPGTTVPNFLIGGKSLEPQTTTSQMFAGTKPKAYAKGGCVSSTPAMKSGGDVKKARGGGCEVKGKTKGRYI